ncbi:MULTISPECIES: SpoIIE family protein phosphatase [Streptomyces]|uniref:SpoIIE family protein phosphatase n=1 Tax=Streptomyces lycii TaxID=2654337 RepID=A0ABQ7FK63_9ACTN|nr:MULTISPECIES: SpoIIE family protein phosphatase [Streptomyces]KAF4409230.1 SpoIIE family protein phosphatase [Streptomyces lycii]PGH49455.1 phosphatase [Streptomyces sp. Ru87]
MRSEDVLAATATGLWRWDTATGQVEVDAPAARLLGLPGPETYGEAAVRSRFHPEDWVEMRRLGTLALAEGTVAEMRVRVVADDGTVLRTVRSRSQQAGEDGGGFLVGLVQELPEPDPGGSHPAAAAAGAGEWSRSREAFLLDAGRALAEARSTDEVLRVTASLSMPGFSPDGLAVYGIDGNRLKFHGYHGYAPEDVPPFEQMPLDAPYPASEVIRTGRAVYLSSPEEYAERYPITWPLIAHFGRRSWAYVPLTVAGRTTGAWMAAFNQPVSFTADERSVLTTVGRMLAQALSRAEAEESERELSVGIQRSMLPTVRPEVPGMTVAARYVPTGGGLQVGGDWYDMIPLPGDRLALVIGDVQGHDVRAASLMGQLRIALRAYAAEGHHPDAVLSRASRFLSGLVGEEPSGGGSSPGDNGADPRFATCLYAEVDPATGTLDIARAGHPHPVTRMSDGTMMIRETAGGLPLGIFPDSDYPTTRLVLEPGELMMFCTDGLIETGGHNMQTGWLRLREAISEHAGEPLEEMADGLIEAVVGPSSHRTTGPLSDRREDDIALLLLCRNGPGCGCGPSEQVHQPKVRRTVMSVAQAEAHRLSETRHSLRDLLHDWADPEQVDAAELMISEMVTNVLMHTDGDAVVVAQVVSGYAMDAPRAHPDVHPLDDTHAPPGPRRLRVDVADSSDELPHRRSPGEMASSGRGLLLLEMLADSWGVDPRGEGKCTWFELTERQPGAAGDVPATPGLPAPSPA